MSYVRKGAGLNTTQLRPCFSRDLIFLQIQTCDLLPLNIINIYNAPVGGTDTGTTIASLMDLPHSLWRSAFLAGDFNLHHPNWDPNHSRLSTQAKPFVMWLTSNNFNLMSEVSEPTYNSGSVLDLAFLTSLLHTITTKSGHMDVTSDHSPLMTIINWSSRGQEPIKRLRPDTLDEKQFTDILWNTLANISTATDATSMEELDSAAINLTKAISEAYTASTKRSLGQNTSQPWWNSDCKAAVQENRAKSSVKSACNLQNTVRNAKTKFWADKLDLVKDMNDVFKMTKWHQSTGNFQSPPLVDPQDPTGTPAKSTNEKRDLLVKELLTNSAEAGDILFDVPMVASRNISFPEITAQDVTALSYGLLTDRLTSMARD